MNIVSISFDANDRLLRVCVEGPFSLAEAQAQFEETAQSILKHSAPKILFDGRAVTGTPGTLQRFLYSEFAVSVIHDLCERGLACPPQLAYVLIEPVLDPSRFGETVAVNRGLNLKVFDNLSEAENWLGVSSEQLSGT